MKTNQIIDPSSFDRRHPLSVALRNVSRYWFLAYSKLLAMEWRYSSAVPYGATDGARLLLNPKGLDKLSRQPNGSGLIAFLLVHEALHALLGHGWRTASMKDKHTANVAADYIINAMIHNRNREIGREVFPFIEGVLLDEALSGDDSVERLYRKLLHDQPQEQPQDNEEEEGSSGGGGEGSSDDDLSDFVGTGAPDNLEPEVGAGETVEEVIERMEQTNDSILMSDAIDRRQQADAGSTGQRIAKQRQDRITVNWVELTRNWLRSTAERGGWNSPFNHVVHGVTGLICAGRRSRVAGTIVLALDTSGSIGAETYAKFLGQAQDIMDELKPEQLVLLSVSHVVADSVVLYEGDAVPTSLKGGGGTMFQPAFDWLEVNGFDPDVMIYLTDGLASDLSSLRPVDYPLLWLSTYFPPERFPIGEVIEVAGF